MRSTSRRNQQSWDCCSFGPVEEVHESAYNETTGEMIREAAVRTKGAGGSSNVDANGFQRILASKSFKNSASNLCDALATLTRRLCTENIDLASIEPILASRLIPMDNGPANRRGGSNQKNYWKVRDKA